VSTVDDPAIRELLTRLARPHPSGGKVIDRAALLAEGGDFPEVIDWIIEHAGRPEDAVGTKAAHGLHGSRNVEPLRADQRRALRYVLPADALS
jgi:hypothetical protein